MSHAPEKPPMLSVDASPEQQAPPARCALATGSASLALDAYRDLMTGPLPSCDRDYRRAIMLAVLIGRQIESEYRDQSSSNIPVSNAHTKTDKLSDHE